MSDDFRPIDTAPRDGSIVEVMAADFGPYRMRWNPSGFNELASIQPGIWEAHDRAFTWSEDMGAGPTHWRPSQSPSEANGRPN